ncbi:DNA replication/repair protein RecF [Candidatus Bandiella euplotis]|uniref:DNA replication and repair protein RecF n=1 Tax=Candidatus Bandiella euplotis TaxID=1664265 RepID=A0ABZ0UPU9_9RICK|nr:DNA replication/repair protein RecF [Candidatus Bandiella woodruffii]WPX97034.1 DNA replication and repair protein RecF [Candidatus Bandiella woodruffii]
MVIGNTRSYISQLVLHNFRNHENLAVNSNGKFVLILGKNGSGKTNVLEAVSILNAGRGMRNSTNSDIITNFDKNLAEWAVIAYYQHLESSKKILFGCNFKHTSSNGKKILKIDEEEIGKKTDILNFLRIVWLTPQMENLFLESPSVRRRFIDRMTFNFFPEHAKQVIEHEYFLQSRNKILSDVGWDEKWLTQIEQRIADLSVKIVDNRQKCLNIINSFLSTFSKTYLRPVFFMKGEVESQLETSNPIKVSDFIMEKLKRNRLNDSRIQKCGIGAHKSEVVVMDKEQNRHANLCSTGEQKSMIIALLLGQSHAIYQHSNIAPILLLDEIFAHLDERRKADLIAELSQTPSQIWISSTDTELDRLIGNATKIQF